MKKIKSFILFGLAMIVCSIGGVSQNKYITINPSSDSMYVINTHDTVICSNIIGCGHHVFYSLDLDHNSIPDYTFEAWCYMGGSSTQSYIRLSSADSSTFSVDSVTDHEGHYDSLGNVYYTDALVPMVRIYSEFDTLYSSECTISVQTNLTHYYESFYPKPCVQSSLDNWIWGPHYIGIRKRIHGVDYLGWIKAEVLDYYTLVIKEYALNNQLVGIPPSESSLMTIYPNPVGSSFFIRNLTCGKVEIYDVFGSLVMTADHSDNGSEMEISVDHLQSGIYFVRMVEKGQIITRKIIKK
ncbi:MAG: T9SS type A sorting domain-containing protein [Bacteroidetes bacterium]|nr:T9SS type A sorting domain-containing protein [Bacteroidota bacterium]